MHLGVSAARWRKHWQAAGQRLFDGRRQEALDAVAAEIGSSAHVVVADLGTAEGADALMAQAAEAVGGSIDILVNNAGLTRDGLSMRMKDEDIDAVLR